MLLTVIGHSSKIDCEPARVWGCPTPAIRVYRRDTEKAKRMLFTSGKIDSKEAGKFGLALKPVPDNTLNAEVETMTEQMSRAPINQLRLLKNLQKGRDGL